MNNDLERRVVVAPVEYRQTPDAPTQIEGYAALFGVETVIGGMFRERIERGAFTDTLRTEDIRVMFNHSADRVLGRMSAGTATITEDGKGLRYQATLNPLDPEAMRVGAQIQRRDVTGSSFSFVVEPKDQIWTRATSSGELPLRIVKRARVFDVGPVAMPAYETTSVSARSAELAAENAQIPNDAIIELQEPTVSARDRAKSITESGSAMDAAARGLHAQRRNRVARATREWQSEGVGR